MAEKQYFVTIIKCAICKKEGVVHVCQSGDVETELKNDSHESGFRYGPICDGEWRVACHKCREKSKALIGNQRIERENFLAGDKT